MVFKILNHGGKIRSQTSHREQAQNTGTETSDLTTRGVGAQKRERETQRGRMRKESREEADTFWEREQTRMGQRQ